MAELVNAACVAWITEPVRVASPSWTVSARGSAMNELNSEHIAREAGADEAIVADVINRLRLVRGNMTDSGFLDLIRDVVRTKVAFAERDAREDLSVVRVKPRDD